MNLKQLQKLCINFKLTLSLALAIVIVVAVVGTTLKIKVEDQIVNGLIPFNEESHSLSLGKRAYWSWMDDKKSSGVIAVTYGAWMGYSVIICVTQLTIPCVATGAALLLYTAALAITAAHRAHVVTVNQQTGGTILGTRDNYGLQYNVTDDQIYTGEIQFANMLLTFEDEVPSEIDQIHQNYLMKRGESAGLTYKGGAYIRKLDSASKKRDDVIIGTLIIAESSLANHTFIHRDGATIPDFYEEIMNSTPVTSTSSSNSTNSENLYKRAPQFESKWMSYQYTDTDSTYSGRWAEAYEAFPNGDEVVSEIQGFIQRYGAWKYCLAMQTSIADTDVYSGVGRENVAKGEIYFNTYGGIDNQCIDPKDGADKHDNGS